MLGIRSLVSYEGHDMASLEQDFRGALDEYIALCVTEGQGGEKPLHAAHTIERSLVPSFATSYRGF